MEEHSSFAVSSWDEDIEDIDEEKNPHDSPEKELLWAAENGMLDKVQELLFRYPDIINVKDSDGYSALHKACSNNFIEMVTFLLDHGADVATTSHTLWQPLHSCCQWNHTQIASILLQRGADVNAQSSGKQTPLHIAASHGTCYNTVQLLLMHPFIKPHLKNSSDETAYEIAKRSSKYYKIFEMADVNLDP